MSSPEPDAPPAVEVDEITAKALEISSAIKKGILASLPPDYAEARKEHFRRKRDAAKSKWRDAEQQRAQRTKEIVERFLLGHSQREIAAAMATNEKRIREVLEKFWPFQQQAGRDNRWVVIRLSPAALSALDAFAGDMLLTRERALERVAVAALQDDCAVARRTLRVTRKVEEDV